MAKNRTTRTLLATATPLGQCPCGAEISASTRGRYVMHENRECELFELLTCIAYLKYIKNFRGIRGQVRS